MIRARRGISRRTTRGTVRFRLLALILPSLFAIAACGDDVTAPVDAGSALVRVSVTRTGDGEGIVTSEGDFIVCGDVCSVDIPRDSVLALQAQALGASTFAGWAGPCGGRDSICRLLPSADVVVEARFERR